MLSTRCSLISALLSALVVLVFLDAPAAHGAARSLRPSSVEGRTLVYDLRGLERGGIDVRGARLRIRRASGGGRAAGFVRIAVARSRVRRTAGRGRLRILAPRHTTRRARRAARLQLTMSTTNTDTGAAAGICALGLLPAGSWPGECWRPYAASSPFNMPIPATAKKLANSDAIVSRLTAWGRPDNLAVGTAGTSSDWSHPTYYAQLTDPVFRLHCFESSWGTCAIEGMQIRVPDRARPAGGGDAHMTVVDQVAGWEYDLYDVRSKPPGGGVLEFRWGGRTRIDGDGLGSAATAANFGNLAGIIRAPELSAGEINHAIFMVVKCDSATFVYPASKSGRSCSSMGLPNTDAPPMGARFQLAMSDTQIAALAVPPWKKAILRAMARYGMYFRISAAGRRGASRPSPARPIPRSASRTDSPPTHARAACPTTAARTSSTSGTTWIGRAICASSIHARRSAPADHRAIVPASRDRARA